MGLDCAGICVFERFDIIIEIAIFARFRCLFRQSVWVSLKNICEMEIYNSRLGGNPRGLIIDNLLNRSRRPRGTQKPLNRADGGICRFSRYVRAGTGRPTFSLLVAGREFSAARQ